MKEALHIFLSSLLLLRGRSVCVRVVAVLSAMAFIISPAFLRAQEDSLCIRYERRTIQGRSMEPMIPNGSKVMLMHDYYKCGNVVRRGDIVAFHNGAEKIPLIKVVCATPEDSVEMRGSVLLVNGDTLRNSGGEVYSFPEGQCKMIEMYTRTGHIPRGSYLLFGDNVRVSTDARRFGVTSYRDIIGKFDLPERFR